MTRGRSGVVSMITTFSGAAVRSEISEAGKFSDDQYQRPSPACRTWPSSARNASRSSAGRRAEDLARLERPLERRGPEVGEQDVQVVRVDPRLLGRAVEQELRVADDVAVDGRGRGDEDRDAASRSAARPGRSAARCRRSSPGSRPGSRRRAGRRRRRARARSCSRRRAPRRRAARARSPGARSAGSRRGSHGPGCAARSSRGAPRAGRSGSPRPRPATGRRRSSGGRPAGTAAPSAAARVRAEPRAPVAGSSSGGSTSSRWRSPDGAPLRSMSRLGRPVRAAASSAGFPIVAEQQTMTGCEP